VSPSLIEFLGSPSGILRDALIVRYSGRENPAVREAIHCKLAALEAELAGPDPTTLERLLAERAAICWFQVHRYEVLLEDAQDLTFRQTEFHLRRIDRAHARFLAACRTLAAVRKLGLPAIQVNIAREQVNVAALNRGPHTELHVGEGLLD
jgi:hypothetical protein